MIIDTSAVVAIVHEEPEAGRCLEVILEASTRRISAGNVLEAYMVVDGANDAAVSGKLDALIANLHLTIEAVIPEHLKIARDAFRRYGKGSGHPARLNYGDCFAYSLARFRNEPLLFVGNDFAQTDIEPAS